MNAVLPIEFPGAIAEFEFHEKRKWRFDWAWPERKIACEYEGGIFQRGRHTRGKGYGNDCDKYNTAAVMGWCVIRTTPTMWRDGRALKMLEWAHKQWQS